MLPLVEALFNFPPLFRLAVSSARAKIEDRAKQLGVSMEGEVEELRGARDWQEQLQLVTDPSEPG